MRRALLVWLLLLPFAASAQDGDAGAPQGVLTKPPALLKQVPAVYPPELADAGVGGTVVMEVDIGADGKVLDLKVVQSAGEAFDAAALAAVRQFEFSPAEVDGQPAPVRIQYAYQFFFQPPPEPEAPALDAGVDGGAPVVNFSGRIVERGTRDPLPAAQVVVGEGDAAKETVSADDGSFALAGVPLGTQNVTVVVAGYETYKVQEDFLPNRRTEVTYFVRKKTYGGFETVVRAPKERREVAQVTLKTEEIKLIPGTAGDAFRVVQNLPGVARAPFGFGLLIVRGGKPWDTKTYVDEANVPLLFHFGGLFSTFNANLLDSLSFQAGNFGADWGRAIGGLVTAEVRTPSKKGWHGYADLNLVDVSALIEGPISESWSVAASFRRSHIDVILPAVLKAFGAEDAIAFSVAPRYYDYQVRAEWRPPKGKSRLFITAFGSSDMLVALLPNPALDPEGRGEFGTSLVYNKLLVGFDHQFSERVDFRTRTSFGVDYYSFTVGSDLYAKSVQFPILSRNTVTVRLPETKMEVVTGLDFQVLPYSVEVQAPPPIKLNQIPDPFASRRLVAESEFYWQVAPALFLDLVWKPLPALKLVGGLRGDYNSQMNKAWFDPRIAGFWQVHERVLIKGGAGLYHQPPDFRQGLLSPTFGNPDLLPEGASQYMVGTEVRFTDAISLDVQLYYKQLFNQARPTLGATGDVNVEEVDLRYTSEGRGRAYGAEVLLRHALTKNFFGWVSYSFSRSERDFAGATSYGLSPFDQPHNLVVVASYKLPYDFILGAKIRYTTGPLNREIKAAVWDANGNYFVPIADIAFTRRLPDFFQLDVRLDKRFVFKQWMLALYLDVQNVTNRGNVEGVIHSYDYSQEAYLRGLPILPVLGVRGEW
ncbi:MAG: TonB-dependent receptor [Myxococcota bacterium]